MKRIFSVSIAVLLAGLFVVFSNACSRKDNASLPDFIPPYIGAELVSFPAGSVPVGFNRSAVVTIKDAISAVTITNAAVTMNGTPLPYSVSDGQYIGDVIASPGATVAFSALVGGGTYTVTGNQFTLYPAISSPASNSSFSAGNPISVVWSAGTPTQTALGYGIGVLNAGNPNGPYVWPGNGYYLQQVSKTLAPQYGIPAGSLAVGDYLVLACIAGNQAAIPNATPDSAIMFIGCSYVPIKVQ